jgi:hypothetical protein
MHSGKLALTGDPLAGPITHDFYLKNHFGLFSIVPGPVVDSRSGTDELRYR